MNTQLLPIQKALRAQTDTEKVAVFARFFKTGPGQYGEGDLFLGLKVPITRGIVKSYINEMTLERVAQLLESPYHEERLAAVLTLVSFAKHQTHPIKALATFYLAHMHGINNWDLIDVSSSQIIGPYLFDILTEKDRQVFLANSLRSDNIWSVRVAVLACFYGLRRGGVNEALDVATQLRNHPHDLIHKAVGWMLREVGKQVGREILLTYLDLHAHELPRTTLRYAIEHLDASTRKRYMAMKHPLSKNP
jgi:3-methyladenine DNA glycosylase AlkD